MQKHYKIKVFSTIISSAKKIVLSKNDNETFFGYYNHSPNNANRLVIFHSTKHSTKNKPSSNLSINICLLNENSCTTDIIDSVYSYNWQMGANLFWLNKKSFIYNSYENFHFVSKVYSVETKRIIKIFDYPVQDAFENKYLLTLNYQRLCSFAPDYGYKNLPKMASDIYMDYSNDGIGYVDFKTGKYELLYSIEDIIATATINNGNCNSHFVNHIMIKPDGNGFIFIHRYFHKKQRYDRLIYSDFKSMKVLLSDQYQSHFCWLDKDTIFGYGQYNGEKGFYSINTISNIKYKHNKLTKYHPKDGHPTVYKEWLCIDSYPSLDRMQTLILYNYKTFEIIKLLEVFHPIHYIGETRCDLHPRFSEDGNRIFIDSVFSGKRFLYQFELLLNN
jgi:hypothetical protein